MNERIEILWRENPKSFQTLPVLLAIKDKNFSWLDKDNEVKFWEIDDLKIDEIKNFIFGSKLIDFFTNGQIKNLQDYALGIEIGLDTHSRKNRSGQTMEKTIENLLISYNLEYQSQKHIYLGGDKKIFDFWVKINDKEYYCETNFFNSQGSKISEVIRSYNHLYKLSEKENINFLWIGDGKGLRTVKEALRNTFFSTKNFMFTISSFVEWINKNLEVKV
ncbi:MAG: Type-2 restriction enzyme MboI [Mycoplasmataceae bacterium]|nr:MAG: Type-2 restriction enzyme MboI [Mycoplasmataceae bacterium]